jgi:hypothetical protein
MTVVVLDAAVLATPRARARNMTVSLQANCM